MIEPINIFLLFRSESHLMNFSWWLDKKRFIIFESSLSPSLKFQWQVTSKNPIKIVFSLESNKNSGKGIKEFVSWKSSFRTVLPFFLSRIINPLLSSTYLQQKRINRIKIATNQFISSSEKRNLSFWWIFSVAGKWIIVNYPFS